MMFECLCIKFCQRNTQEEQHVLLDSVSTHIKVTLIGVVVVPLSSYIYYVIGSAFEQVTLPGCTAFYKYLHYYYYY